MDDEVFQVVKQFMEQRVPFNKFLGMRLQTLDQGRAVLELPFREEFIGDPFRPALHGGVISTLLDTCGGAAVFSTLTDIQDRTSTVDLRIDYLRPGGKDTLVAEAEVVRAGNRVAVVRLCAYHPGLQQQPIATGTGVYNIRRAGDK